MPDYTRGKIYKIVPFVECEDGDVYFGSTTKKTLAERMTKHRSDYKAWNSKKQYANNMTTFKLFDKYGVENCKIILVESFPCKTKDELTQRESHYIRTMNCVNWIVPDRTVKEYSVMYREENKVVLSEYDKKYKENNKEALALKGSVSHVCECGKTYTQCHKHRHENTIFHKKWLETKIIRIKK